MNPWWGYQLYGISQRDRTPRCKKWCFLLLCSSVSKLTIILRSQTWALWKHFGHWDLHSTSCRSTDSQASWLGLRVGSHGVTPYFLTKGIKESLYFFLQYRWVLSVEGVQRRATHLLHGAVAGRQGRARGCALQHWHLLADCRGDRSLPLSLWATGSVPQSCLSWQYRLRAHCGWARVRGLVCWLSASPPPPGLLEDIFVMGHRPLSLVNFRNTI